MAKWSLAFGAFVIISFFSSCGGKSILSPDCHTCMEEAQNWNDVSWKDFAGHWTGNVETVRNEKVKIKREKTEQPADFQVVSLEEFYQGYGLSSCEGITKNAFIVNGKWWTNDGIADTEKKEFEAFVPAEDDQISYGRLTVENQNCHYQKLGRVMNKNRLALPAAKFTRNKNSSTGRTLASSSPVEQTEEEVSVEFLRFAPKAISATPVKRGPASADELRSAPLMIRVFQVLSKKDINTMKSEWISTTERIYRMRK